MKTVVLMIALGFCNGNKNEAFEQWALNYNIQVEYHDKYYDNWMRTDEYIRDTNSKGLPYTVSHNQFSHLKRTLLHKGTPKSFNSTDINRMDINWVDYGAVTPVKNQGSCNGCWSFATISAVESAYYLQTNKLVDFSPQQLIDCDIFSFGCGGGKVESAYNWVTYNNLCAEQEYPYVSKKHDCRQKCSNHTDIRVVQHVNIESSNDNAVMDALKRQPLVAAIDASELHFYRSGIFTGNCGTNLNHAVLIVGAGVENGIDYYLLKNSWGVSWGERGYMKIARGKHKDGLCGLLLEVTCPAFLTNDVNYVIGVYVLSIASAITSISFVVLTDLKKHDLVEIRQFRWNITKWIILNFTTIVILSIIITVLVIITQRMYYLSIYLILLIRYIHQYIQML